VRSEREEQCRTAGAVGRAPQQGPRHFDRKQVSLLNLPDSRVRRIGTSLPAEAIEANSLQGVQIDAFETARVDHVVRGVGARTVEGSNTAVATEVVECTTRAELIRRKGFVSLHEMESIWRYHVMEVALTLADRAIAFAHPRKLGSNLELDATAMARTSIGLHFAGGCHASSLAVQGSVRRRLINWQQRPCRDARAPWAMLLGGCSSTPLPDNLHERAAIAFRFSLGEFDAYDRLSALGAGSASPGARSMCRHGSSSA
jgi:hypothetical protein